MDGAFTVFRKKDRKGVLVVGAASSVCKMYEKEPSSPQDRFSWSILDVIGRESSPVCRAGQCLVSQHGAGFWWMVFDGHGQQSSGTEFLGGVRSGFSFMTIERKRKQRWRKNRQIGSRLSFPLPFPSISFLALPFAHDISLVLVRVTDLLRFLIYRETVPLFR